MRRIARLLMVCSVLCAAGCGKQDFGYAEILLGHPGLSVDTYALGGEPIATLRRKASALVRYRVGRADLTLMREGRSWTLCPVEIRKNRIAKVRIVSTANVIRCEL